MDMKTVFTQNLQVFWGETFASDQEIVSYLELVKKVDLADNKFNIAFDELTGEHYCILAISNEKLVIRISDGEKDLL